MPLLSQILVVTRAGASPTYILLPVPIASPSPAAVLTSSIVFGGSAFSGKENLPTYSRGAVLSIALCAGIWILSVGEAMRMESDFHMVNGESLYLKLSEPT